MEWVLRSPQIHSTFSNLGYVHADGYHVNENCDAALESILYLIISEDKYLRTFRRSISFGQNVKKDLIPLFIHAKEDKTIELLVKILLNLTIPIECLLSVEILSKNDFGRQTIFEINNLLVSTKVAFTDHRATKVLIEFLKKNMTAQKAKLSLEQCTNINNSLLLLRNILHLPEATSSGDASYLKPSQMAQNQILWNIFSQRIDKILIKLITFPIPDAAHWCVTMIQLIGLLYKDQHAAKLHKLINTWLEGSLSESSEDNESNTSMTNRGSAVSSPMLSSDPKSDSSDNNGSSKRNDGIAYEKNDWDSSSLNNTSNKKGYQPLQLSNVNAHAADMKAHDESPDADNSKDKCMESKIQKLAASGTSGIPSEPGREIQNNITGRKNEKSENSNCAYGIQIENHESISTSSNDDERPDKKPLHQKLHYSKQGANNKRHHDITLQDKKRLKVVKRGKSNIVNVQWLYRKTPNDDDISNVLKEFTVDFLMKGFNPLVLTLHDQILTNPLLEIDSSHFFWLVTYFLKFATQIELDLKHVSCVLSFDIVSYLTAEGVKLCEQIELASRTDGTDLKPYLRRLHLVITAIRELVQVIEMYKKALYISEEDEKALLSLQMKICETEELRSLLVLLLRYYNPKHHTKQYLQDLIITNHILLLFLDDVMTTMEYQGSTIIHDHLQQFASREIMFQYGILLEDYMGNDQYLNDCIFTVMHHVGGDLDSLITLYQPKILKTFTEIWKTEFEICDDWADLIEYVINTFIKKPHSLQAITIQRLEAENFDDDENQESRGTESNDKIYGITTDRWTEDERSALGWNFMQCSTSSDVTGDIIKMFKDDGIIKSRDSVIQELFKLNMINKEEYEKICKEENDKNSNMVLAKKEMKDDEISKLCEQLALDGRSKTLQWVQKALLETCYAKIYLQKKSLKEQDTNEEGSKLLSYDLFKKKPVESPVVSSVSYYSLLINQFIPLVPWNNQQAAACKEPTFMQLLHKLGFQMPVDSGKVFIRIPNFWTPIFLYEVAGKVCPIDTTHLKFSLNDIMQNSVNSEYHPRSSLSTDMNKDNVTMVPNNFCQIQNHNDFQTLVKLPPMPLFITDYGAVDNCNWLEMVQKSQETRLTLNLPSHAMAAVDSSSEAVKSPLSSLQQDGDSKQDSSPPIFNNSGSDTESMVSDQTRMFVSDEEQSETLLAKHVSMDF